MRTITRATQLYTFLWHCEHSPLEKEVLDCGAGGPMPPLRVFHEQGYRTHGIELSEKRLAMAHKFCQESGIDLDIQRGDMRELPFADSSISFVYSFNTIFHMTNADMALAVSEIERVLRPGGLSFVNLLSVDDEECGVGRELEKGEFLQDERGSRTIHTYHEDGEPEAFFKGSQVIWNQKRVVDWILEGRKIHSAYLDYIVQKN